MKLNKINLLIKELQQYIDNPNSDNIIYDRYDDIGVNIYPLFEWRKLQYKFRKPVTGHVYDLEYDLFEFITYTMAVLIYLHELQNATCALTV